MHSNPDFFVKNCIRQWADAEDYLQAQVGAQVQHHFLRDKSNRAKQSILLCCRFLNKARNLYHCQIRTITRRSASWP
jgi:hypothetical protein